VDGSGSDMAALIMSILIALGCVLCIGLMTMACYCFYARRKGLRNVLFFRGSGQLRDEESENILPSTSSSVTVEHSSGNKAIGSGCSANTHPAYGMARKIRWLASDSGRHSSGPALLGKLIHAIFGSILIRFLF